MAGKEREFNIAFVAGGLAAQGCNASLISASPDLLAAAELFEQWDNSGDEDGITLRDVRKMCRAAIAKAKGEV